MERPEVPAIADPACAGMRLSRGFANIAAFRHAIKNMIETNPIAHRIADLSSRLASLRGYL